MAVVNKLEHNIQKHGVCLALTQSGCRPLLFLAINFLFFNIIFSQTATDDFNIPNNVFGGAYSGAGWVNDSWVRSGNNDNVFDVQALDPTDTANNIAGSVLQLDDNDAGAYRIIDFSDVITATLSFEYDYDDILDGGEELLIQIDPENDGTYITIQTITASNNSPNPPITETITIPSNRLGGANTRIQFITGANNSINLNNEDWWIDNIIISYTLAPDSDGDGIRDITDLDDDNDGIPDAIEQFDTNTHLLSTGGPSTITTGPMSSLIIELSALDNSFNLTINGVNLVPVELQFNPQSALSGHSVARFASDNSAHNNNGNSNIWGFNWNNANPAFLLMRLEIDENGMVSLQGKRNVSSPLEDMIIAAPDPNFNVIPLNDTGANVISFSQQVQGPTHFYSTLYARQYLDTDTDGIRDYLDLDSDNDGIYDAVEAGHGQTHTNGVVTGNLGTDGIPDAVQSAPNNGLINYTISDSDSDAIYDFLELDADNDSCNDTTEAGYTDANNDGMLGTDPTLVDSNGLVIGTNVTDGYTVPNNADGNLVFDFQEAGIAASITNEPSDLASFAGTGASFIASVDNTTTYQWQISTDGGITFTNLSNDGLYNGTDTPFLTISTANVAMDNDQFRLIGTNTAFGCSPPIISRIAVLNISTRTIITNRRITYRVNKS